jgi:hypothetical protein
MTGEAFVLGQPGESDSLAEQAWDAACGEGDYVRADRLTHEREYPFTPVTYPVHHDHLTPKELVCDLALATFSLIRSRETQDDSMMAEAERDLETAQIMILADRFSRENPFVN